MFDYGTLENTIGVDPSNSRTGMSDPLTFVPQAVNLYLELMSNNLFIEDNSTLSEFACQKLNKLYIYDVQFGLTTGTSSMYLANQMTVPFGVYGSILSLRRINSDLYYGYYAKWDVAGTMDFRRCALTSSGATDASIASVTIPPPPSGLVYDAFLGLSPVLVSGKKIYFTISATSSEWIDGFGNIIRKEYFYTYCFDTALETATLISSILLPTQSGNNGVSGQIYLRSSSGAVSISVIYRIFRVTPYVPPFIDQATYYSIFGGSTSFLFTYSSTTFEITSDSRSGRYNYKNWIDTTHLHTDLGDDYYITLSEDGVVVLGDDSRFPDVVTPTVFVSADYFPHVGSASGTFYWLDVYGKIDEPIALAGVSYIHNIFPTLDTVNGSIYMTARMVDETDQLLLVDPVTKGISTIITVLGAPWGLDSIQQSDYTFNHGNFFFHINLSFPSDDFVATYIDKVPAIFGLNDSIMLEKN